MKTWCLLKICFGFRFFKRNSKKEYDVTYPTVRLRLDRLIQKIKVCDEMDNDPYIALVKRFAVDEKIDFDTAKRLIAEYKKQVEKGGK